MNTELSKVFNEDELLGLTRKLINIPSYTTYKNREKEVALFLEKVFKEEGIDCYLQQADQERCNIIATLKGNGTGKSLMLNGHLDTVPVDGMDDPFGAVVKDGFMYGRGAADMKSGVAAMAYALILLKRMGAGLDGDLVFAGVIDEEAAKSTGSRVIAEQGPLTDFAIVGEPTGLFPVIAHKGIDYFEIEFSGKAAHSSLPKNGANAIFAAAQFITFVREKLVPLYETLIHPLVGAPTINVGLITGSAKINQDFLLKKSETFAGVIPDSATVYVDVRWTPLQSIPEILEHLNQAVNAILPDNPGVTAEVRYIPLPRPAMEIAQDAKLTSVLLKSTTAISPETANVKGVSYFADSGILYGVGKIQSLVFGPGDIAVAHSIQERVEVSQIFKAAKIYAETALEVCINQ